MLWKGVGLYHMSSICSRFDHTLTCQANLILMSEHTEGKMTYDILCELVIDILRQK